MRGGVKMAMIARAEVGDLEFKYPLLLTCTSARYNKILNMHVRRAKGCV